MVPDCWVLAGCEMGIRLMKKRVETMEHPFAGAALALPKQVSSGEFKRSQLNPQSRKSWAVCTIWDHGLLLTLLSLEPNACGEPAPSAAALQGFLLSHHLDLGV